MPAGAAALAVGLAVHQDAVVQHLDREAVGHPPRVPPVLAGSGAACSGRSDRDAGGGHDRLGLGHGVLAEVEDRRGQHRVGAARAARRRPGAPGSRPRRRR